MKDDNNRLHPQLQLKIMYNFSTYLCVPLRVWLKCDVYDPHKHNGQSHEMVNYLLRGQQDQYTLFLHLVYH